MSALPDFRLGFLNAWLFLAAYAAGLLLALVPFSSLQRDWLFADPKQRLPAMRRLLLRLGQVVAAAFVLSTLFAPLRFQSPLFPVAVVLCGLGFAAVILALYYFRRAPGSGPVTAGPYRYSRNPQWVGLFLVLLGTALATGAWLLVGAVVVVAAIYHLQILAEEELCRGMYGDAYQRYCDSVPRYLLFF